MNNTVLTGVGLTRLKARWMEIKPNSINTFISLINQTAELIRPSFNENFDLWKMQGMYVWPNPPAIAAATTLDQHATLMKDWVTKRIAWMSTQLG